MPARPADREADCVRGVIEGAVVREQFIALGVWKTVERVDLGGLYYPLLLWLGSYQGNLAQRNAAYSAWSADVAATISALAACHCNE